MAPDTATTDPIADTYPPLTLSEHGNPRAGVWHGYADPADADPDLIGRRCLIRPASAGGFTAEFADGTKLSFTTDRSFRFAPDPRPAYEDLHTIGLRALKGALDDTSPNGAQPEELLNWLEDNGYRIVHPEETHPDRYWYPTPDAGAADEMARMFHDMILRSDGTHSDTTAVLAGAIADQVQLDFHVRWEHHVNVDPRVNANRGRAPDDPTQYVRRIVMYGPYQPDPDGKRYHDGLAAQLPALWERSRKRDLAYRDIVPDGATVLDGHLTTVSVRTTVGETNQPWALVTITTDDSADRQLTFFPNTYERVGSHLIEGAAARFVVAGPDNLVHSATIAGASWKGRPLGVLIDPRRPTAAEKAEAHTWLESRTERGSD